MTGIPFTQYVCNLRSFEKKVEILLAIAARADLSQDEQLKDTIKALSESIQESFDDAVKNRRWRTNI